ncbi:MAG: hypothetical protein R8K46_10255 [Mariprofundaceae bacterium]
MKRARTGRFVMLCSLLTLAACAGAPPFDSADAPLRFRTHLIVLEPEARWQATVDWRAKDADNGLARLTHIVSGRIVELRWRQGNLWLRDNQTDSCDWHRIPARQLIRHGISLLPGDVILLLNGQTPPDFTPNPAGGWQGQRFDKNIHVTWNAERKRLTIIDDEGRRMLLDVRG